MIEYHPRVTGLIWAVTKRGEDRDLARIGLSLLPATVGRALEQTAGALADPNARRGFGLACAALCRQTALDFHARNSRRVRHAA